MNTELETKARAAYKLARDTRDEAQAQRELGWKLCGVGANRHPTPEGEAAHERCDVLTSRALGLQADAALAFMLAGMIPPFVVTGHCQTFGPGKGEVSFVEARAYAGTKDEAVRIASSFPKSYRLVGCGCSGMSGLSDREYGTVSIRAQLSPDGNNKGANEAGLARMRKFLARVEHEFEVAFCSNAATVDQLKEILQ